MSPEFVEKYMMMAKNFGTIKNSCRSRQIGAIIVNPNNHCIVGAGYNGSARGLPHCDSREYLSDYVFPMLNPTEVGKLESMSTEQDVKSWFVNSCESQCPRRFLGYKSGERSELCAEVHAEQNAIINCQSSSHHCYMFAWCGVPCPNCALHIVNSGISRIYCLKDNNYGTNKNREYERSKWILRNVDVIELEERMIGAYEHETTNGVKFLVDLNNSDFVRSLSWFSMPNGYIQCKSAKYKDKYIHRILVGASGRDINGLEIDHIDRDKANNRLINLRICTHSQNHMNKGPASNNTSGYKGVYLSKSRKRWIAEIKLNGKKKYIGSYSSAEEASEAYNKEAERVFGSFNPTY